MLIRFKKNNGSEYPQWEEKRLGEVLEISSKPNNGKYSKEEVLSVSDKFGVVNQIKLQGRSFAGEDISKYKVVETDDIIYTKSPLLEKPFGIIKIVKNEIGAVSPLYIVNKAKNGNYPLFIYYYFDTPSRTNNYLKPLIRKGAKNTMNISNEEWLSGRVKVPCFEEQQKIADFLSTVDQKIEAQKVIIADYEELKKGTIQKIFNQEIRFKDDDGNEFPEWMEKRLGDTCNIFAGGTPSTNKSEYWGTDILWIQSGLVQNCIINKKDIKTSISKLGLSKSSAKMIKPNSVLLAMTGATCGNVGYLTCSACANQSVMAFEPLEDNAQFLYYVLLNGKNYILNYQAGGAQAGINKKSCTSFTFKFPCLEEQKKITDCLSALDRKIETEKEILADLEELKKGLLLSIPMQ